MFGIQALLYTSIQSKKVRIILKYRDFTFFYIAMLHTEARGECAGAESPEISGADGLLRGVSPQLYPAEHVDAAEP